MTDHALPAAAEGLACVLCGKPLVEGAIECDACSVEPSEPVPGSDEIETLMRRARGWLLIGAFFLPLLSSLIALSYSSQALELYREGEVIDPGLEGSIKRVHLAALVLTGAFSLVALAVIRWL